MGITLLCGQHHQIVIFLPLTWHAPPLHAVHVQARARVAGVAWRMPCQRMYAVAAAALAEERARSAVTALVTDEMRMRS